MVLDGRWYVVNVQCWFRGRMKEGGGRRERKRGDWMDWMAGF